MATSLCSLLAAAALWQTPASAVGPPVPATTPAPDSLAVLRARVARDSTDAAGWLLLGRGYLERGDDAHGALRRAAADSVVVRAWLDTADQALVRAATLFGPAGASVPGDSARALRVGVWSARARLAWAERGIATGPQEWGPVPPDLKVPPVLEELGENLLRACPMWGVLLTAGDADSYAAWYMRFARGLRPDLLTVPLSALRADSGLRARVAADLRLGRRTAGDAWLHELVKRRPVCVTMAFERPPEPRPRIGWAVRPFLWVAGPEGRRERVPARDYVFAALRIALDERDPWAAPALTVYAHGARVTPALCEPLRTFKVASDVASCRH
ncbi:MAG TPA: hypothetical protein VH116_00600 [Gemmatimonadales bacterium]|jgi:hypothetical protein|nr:hypothetical protein [Gemmatimonadales bacterium]